MIIVSFYKSLIVFQDYRKKYYIFGINNENNYKMMNYLIDQHRILKKMKKRCFEMIYNITK